MRSSVPFGVAALLCGGISCGTGAPTGAGLPDADLASQESALSSACTGLVPALPAGVYFEEAVGTHTGCIGGMGDAAGHLATLYNPVIDPALRAILRDPATGAQLAGFSTGFDNTSGDGAEERWMLFPQRTGFLGITYPGTRTVESYDGSGALVRSTASGISLVGALDYGGGLLAVGRPLNPDGSCCASGWTAQRFDSSALPRSAPATVLAGIDGTPIAAVNLSGYSFVGVIERSTAGAQLSFVWLDRYGNHLAVGALAVAVPANPDGPADLVEARPLLDGSVVLRDNGQWFARVPSASGSAVAAPGWLAARPHWDLSLRPAGKGYALIEPGGKLRLDCAQNIEVHAPAGNNCGTLRVRSPASAGCTGAIPNGPLMMGRDGSVLRSLAVNHTCGFGACCGQHLWSRLLE